MANKSFVVFLAISITTAFIVALIVLAFQNSNLRAVSDKTRTTKNASTCPDVTCKDCPALSPTETCPELTPSAPNVHCIDLKTAPNGLTVTDRFTDVHYFPFVSDLPMTFKNAVDYCNSYEGYTLAGLNALSHNFMEDTKKLVLEDANVNEHWMAGYFKVDEESKRDLIYWLDGSKSDAGKADYLKRARFSNEEVKELCSNENARILEAKKLMGMLAGNSIESMDALKNARASLDGKTCELILPIVRDVKTSILRPDTSLVFDSKPAEKHALCMKQEPTPYTKMTDGTIVPTRFIKHAFDVDTKSFLDTKQLLITLSATGSVKDPKTDNVLPGHLWPVRIHNNAYVGNAGYDWLFVGWAQAVSYEYAEKFCKLVQYANEATDTGSLLGKKHLRDDPQDKGEIISALTTSIYYLWERSDQDRTLRLENGFSDLLLATDARFYFDHPDFKYNQLVWKSKNNEKEDATNQLSFNLGWCEDDYSLAVHLEKIHADFDKWRNNEGKSTTGPYVLPVAVSAKGKPAGNEYQPCLRLVPANLYWPVVNMVPVCEKSKPKV